MGENKRENEKLNSSRRHRKVYSDYVIGKGAIWTLRTIVVVGIVVGIIGVMFGMKKFYDYTSEVKNVDVAKLQVSIPSKILDSEGNELAELGVEAREEVEIDEVPQLLKDALIYTEDKRFYEHRGIDLIRIGKAVLTSLRGGFGEEGGSTLTQQIVKLSYLDPNESSLKRKAKEAYLALDLEKRFTKDRILELYMNKVYMANGVYGFATASKYYYGKPLSDLTLPQLAIIAGLPNSPEWYNPYTNPEGLKDRRDVVLYSMYVNGKITKQEYKDAVAVNIMDGILPKENHENRFKIPLEYNSAVTIIIAEAEKTLGEGLYTDGYTIKTSINKGMEDYLKKLTYTEDIYNYNGDKDIIAGVVILDNSTGRLLAESGSNRNMEYTNQGFNYATDIERQPGSSMKPILSYAPAIEYLGYNENSYITDEPYKYSTGQEVYNWDKSYVGSRTLKDQLAMSRNIPAIKLLKEVGLDKAYGFANKLGMGIPKDQYVESGAIGGISNASPLKMAQAFNSFANGGNYVASHSIISIEDRDGIEVYSEPSMERVMDENTAVQVSNMLRAVVTAPYGTGGLANVPGQDIRGKTGTTNYSDEELAQYGIPSNYSPDSWFVGFNDKYTVAVWIGYDSRKQGLSPNNQSMAMVVANKVFKQIGE